MTQAEKYFLIMSGAFTTGALMIFLFMPQQSPYRLPDFVQILIYISIAAIFLLFIKHRKNLKLAQVFMWILLGFLLLAIVLLALSSGMLLAK